MGKAVTVSTELDAPQYGPKMSALSPLQQRLVDVYLEHPTWSATAMAEAAGYSKSSAPSRGSINLRDPKVQAAINEEGSRRLKMGGPLAVMGLMAMVLNPNHKDHFKACDAVANRTGFHPMSEHKVTVEDRRPQSREELIAAVKLLASECDIPQEDVARLTGETIVDAEFVEVSDEELTQEEIDASIAKQMEDL